MADPLSIAGSLVGIIALADVVATKGWRIFKSIKDCPKEIEALVNETESLCAILGRLKRQATVLQTTNSSKAADTLPGSLQDSPSSPLVSCQKTLEMVGKLLGELETKPNETIKNAGKRLTWKFKKEEITDLMGRLERHKSNFKLALQLDEMYEYPFVLVHSGWDFFRGMSNNYQGLLPPDLSTKANHCACLSKRISSTIIGRQS